MDEEKAARKRARWGSDMSWQTRERTHDSKGRPTKEYITERLKKNRDKST